MAISDIILLDFLDLCFKTFQGSATETENTNFLDPAFFSNQSLYNLEPQCSANATIPVSVQIASSVVTQGIIQSLGAVI